MKKLLSGLVIILGLSGILLADKITVFAASSTKLAMEEIIKEFESQNPKDEIVITYTATGKAYAQFTNGFKYDIFLAADTKYPQQIVDDGNAISETILYAMGAVALFSHDLEILKDGMDAIKSEKVKFVSIANPRLAPYGVAAMEILKNYELEEIASKKLVLGDTIAQSVQFVDSGAAEIGLVAFSLIKTTKKESEYIIIDQDKFSPMKQSFVLTKHAKDKPLASKFGEFLLSEFAQDRFEKYGFGKAN